MAVSVLTNAQVLINGIDLSDHTVSVTLNDSRAPVDLTAMGASNITYGKGLGDATATFVFLTDWAAGKVHATLQPLIGSSTGVAVEVRPVNGARSATNPAFLMTALLFEYPMIDASIGDANKGTFVFQNSAQAGVTYPTA